VADLGAGTGKVSRAAARRGWRVIAVEPGQRMLEVLTSRARAEGLQVSAVLANAEATGLPDASVDAALAGEAYHWFDPPRALAEMARIVRPGGGIAFFWNVVDGDRSRLVAAERKLVAEYQIDGSDIRRPGPSPETRDAIRAAGGFDEPMYVRVPHAISMTGADYVGLAYTKSHLRTAPADIQAAFRDAFTSMLRAEGIGATDRIVIPYVTDCWIARRSAP
jgi:ubiquinone/menaquinone biosynthesis C-methylase UbiE